MSVVFSTYQSTEVISSAQKSGIPKFDLMICDEAHRTTGVTLAGKDDSYFTRIHNDDAVAAEKPMLSKYGT